MVGGVLFEHGHRMIAGVVLVLTLILTVWLLRREERRWVRNLGLVAFFAVVFQAVLGGVTVLLRLPVLTSVSHAGLAMAFFCVTVSIAMFTSTKWREDFEELDGGRVVALRRLAVVTTGVIYLQILLGAVMRHTGAGLAIPDFPLSYGRLFPPYLSTPIMIHYAHRVGAVVVSALVVLLILRIVKYHRNEERFLRPAFLLALLLVQQLLLGALTIWTRRAVIPTTAHVAFGAAVLAISLMLTLRSYRLQAVGIERSGQPLLDSHGMKDVAAPTLQGSLLSRTVGGTSGGARA
jgi:cytochrome c oxidase assembly protein subunit 15